MDTGPTDIVDRSEVFALLMELKQHIMNERRKFLVDGRQIEAAACNIQAVCVDSAISVLRSAKRRG